MIKIKYNKNYFLVEDVILKYRKLLKNSVWVLFVLRLHPDYSDLQVAQELDMQLSDVISDIQNLQNNGFIEYKQKFHGKISNHISKSVREELTSKYLQCAICGSMVDLQIDHIIPRSKGGGRNIENLQILCKKCNIKKSSKVEEKDG